MEILHTAAKGEREEGSLIPGLKLLDIFNLEEKKDEVRVLERRKVKIQTYTFQVTRILLHENKNAVFHKDLNVVRNELISPQMVGSDLYLDFVFWEGLMIGIVPVLFKLKHETITDENLKRPPFAICLKLHELRYYDFSDLWFDLNIIQPYHVETNPAERNRNNHLEILKKVQSIETGILLYLDHIYGANVSCIHKIPQTKFILESFRQGFYYYQSFLLAELLSYFEDVTKTGRILEGKVYVSMPSAYVPGKFIDMEYYNAIYEDEFGIKKDDNLLVIGYGTGIDLIHAAKKCDKVYGVEVNPFSVASARTNYVVSGVESDVIMLWEDVRVYKDSKESLEEKDTIEEMEKVNRLLWNMPYENVNDKKDPLQMHDFFDNYSVLEWFLPWIATSKQFNDTLKVLLWNLKTDEGMLKEKVKDYGFHAYSDPEKNIFILNR